MFRRLLWLNGLAAFAIPVYHAAAYGISAMFLWTDRYMPVAVPNYDQLGSPEYYGLMIIRQLCAYAIPAFIFIPGVFISFSAQGPEGMPWQVVRNRIQSLLLPFVLWTLFRFAMLRNLPDNLDDVFSPYYFIVLICQFYALSPLLARLAKRNWKLLLVGAALMQFGTESLFFLGDLGVESNFMGQLRQVLPLWFFPRRIFWFVLGIVVGFQRPVFIARLAPIRRRLLAATILLAIMTLVEYEFFARLAGEAWLGPSFRGVSSRLYSLAFLLSFVAFDKARLPLSKELSELGGKSLGIYLMNIPVIYIIGVFLYEYLPWTLGNQLVYQAILISAGLLVPLWIMKIVRKTPVRWAYRYVFG